MSQEVGPVEDLRLVVAAAVERAIAKGFRIVDDTYGVEVFGLLDGDDPFWSHAFPFEEYSCCPMGAVLLGQEEPVYRPDPWDSAARVLGVAVEWVKGFVDGFDGGDGDVIDRWNLDPYADDLFLYEMGVEVGRELREVYRPRPA